MNFCPKCRKRLVVQDFCVECGADLTEYLNAPSPTEDGIGSFDFSVMETEAKKQLSEQERINKIKEEFEIENGCLVKYKGNGGSITIPKEITKIGEKAFYENDNVTDISFEEGVKEIDTFAFKDMKALKTVTLPSSLEKIGYGIFMDSTVNEVVFSDGLKELSSATFDSCRGLKRVELPSTLEKICENAFTYTRKLLAIFIPKSVKYIERGAFCSETLVDIYFEAPSLPSTIEKGDCDDYDNWKHQCYACEHYGCQRNNVIIPDYDIEAKNYGSSLESYDSSEFKVHNPHAVYCIKEMSEVRFPYGTAIVYGQSLEDCKGPRTIQFPKTTTVIDSGFVSFAMPNRENNTLTSVYAENATKIGSSAFSKCYALTSFYNTDNIEIIESEAFNDCTQLVNFNFPPRLKKLGSYAFYKVPAFKNIKIPSSLEKIGGSAFDSCPNLESVEISDGVKTIGSHAFCDCKKLKTVKIPQSVTEIEKFAFSSCDGLEAIELPEGLITLGDSAFGYCKNLKTVKIPYSLQTITAKGDWDWSTFQHCESLQFVYIPRGRLEAYRAAFPSSYVAPNLKFIEY